MDRRTVFCVVLAALLTVFATCAGVRVMGQADSPVPERPPVLYAAGWEDNSGYYDVAMVWKINDSTVMPIVLTDRTQTAVAWGITAAGGSLYVTGREPARRRGLS
ncbi:MAG: hypothetical protein LBK74_04345 [Treponema sp.]|jgi:hypothetical protein|nr:hypothetical protein [Treponema sp.]